MDKAFRIRLAGLEPDDLAVERELHDVSDLDAIRRARTRHQEMIGIVRMTDRYMAERIKYVIVGKNPVRRHKILFQRTEVSHLCSPANRHPLVMVASGRMSAVDSSQAIAIEQHFRNRCGENQKANLEALNFTRATRACVTARCKTARARDSGLCRLLSGRWSALI